MVSLALNHNYCFSLTITCFLHDDVVRRGYIYKISFVYAKKEEDELSFLY